VIGEPFSVEVLHDTSRLPNATVASVNLLSTLTFAGAVGTATGVAETASESAESPTELVALTETE
jgi:hypothetical protein